MNKFFRFFVLICLFIFSFSFFSYANEFGETAIKYLEQISRIQRVAFTDGEVYTCDYMGRLLKNLGYDVTYEEIGFPDNTVINFNQGQLLSHNLIATKKGASDLEVVIGANYDSEDVQGSTGFEGATGPALIIELANKFKDIKLPYTLKFVLFGSGKQGNVGSTHYVSTRSQDELNKIMYFINVSSLGSGKELYIYGNNGNKGFVRDEILSLGKDLDIKVSTSKEFEDYNIPKGVGYDLGEHVPFKYSNVPFAFMEATSWRSVDEKLNIPDDPTEDNLGILDGSSNDNYETIMEAYSDRVKDNLANASELIFNNILKDKKSIKIITVLTEENSNLSEPITYTLIKDGKKVKTSKLKSNMIVEFENLENGNYTVEVKAPDSVKFLKDISSFEFNFDSDGEFVFVNDEIDTYTFREGFTDNYITVRDDIQKTEYNIKVKKILLDYSATAEVSDDPQEDKNNNDPMIKTLGILLVILIIIYIIVRIIFSKINKKL